MDGLVQSGLAYTSARGGGTCNSEFEFLTGSTLGSLGGGVYPYMFYDMSVPESLPHYFAAQGYGTTAIHPAEASNWRRDVVYGQMGFDEFDQRGRLSRRRPNATRHDQRPCHLRHDPRRA